MSSKVTAQELRDIRSSYDTAVTDYSACVGAKELEYWADCAERSIDRHVQTLDRGVSKQNQALFKEVGAAYQRLLLKLDAQYQKAAHSEKVISINAFKCNYTATEF